MILSEELVNILTSDEYMEAFCEYDDYNWDFSLFHTVLVKKPMRVFYPLIPRVFHLGTVFSEILKKSLNHESQKILKSKFPKKQDFQKNSKKKTRFPKNLNF